MREVIVKFYNYLYLKCLAKIDQHRLFKNKKNNKKTLMHNKAITENKVRKNAICGVNDAFSLVIT